MKMRTRFRCVTVQASRGGYVWRLEMYDGSLARALGEGSAWTTIRHGPVEERSDALPLARAAAEEYLYRLWHPEVVEEEFEIETEVEP